ncbi:MAG: cell division protein SepF [Ruminococcaceae bacterium]|nr:cell division protein SepF [Oscillospiraceae bacterium]
MGLFENIMSKIAPVDPVEEQDYNEQDYKPEQAAYIPRDPRSSGAQQTASVPTPAKVSSVGTNVMGSAIEMKVVKPREFDAVADIANLLLDGNTVLLNLEDTNKETTRRLIDFMTGVAYAINGDLRRIANNTYVVTPNNVKVSDNEEAVAMPSVEAEDII